MIHRLRAGTGDRRSADSAPPARGSGCGPQDLEKQTTDLGVPQGYTMGPVMPLVGGATDPMYFVTAPHCPLGSNTLLTLLADVIPENVAASLGGHQVTGSPDNIAIWSTVQHVLGQQLNPPDPAVTTSGGPQGDIYYLPPPSGRLRSCSHLVQHNNDDQSTLYAR